MKLKLIILFQLVVFSGIYAQDTEAKNTIIDLLSKSKKMYENNEGFKLNTNYKLYPTYTSKSVSEEYKGLVVTKEKMVYTKIGSAEFVSLNDNYLHIDNESKLIDYKKAGTGNEALSFFDFFEFLNKFSYYSIKKQGNITVCTLSSAEITFVPYSKIEIYVDNTTQQITKQVFYLLMANKYKDKDGNIKSDYPRMEVTFSNFKKRPFTDFDKKFILKSYIQQTGKDKYSVTEDYKGYTIIDSKN